MTKTTSVLVFGELNVLHPGDIRVFKFAHGFGEQLLTAVEINRLLGNAARGVPRGCS